MGSKGKELMSSGKGKVRVVAVKSVRTESPARPPNPEDEEYGYRLKEMRNFFLQCLAGIYFMAFLSVYLQADGLYGTNGVTPIKSELKLTSKTPQQCLKAKYTWLCLIPQFFGIDSQHALDLVALLGVMISAVATMCAHVCTLPVMIILWGLYYSIVQVGGVFMHFQWDILLLEAGALGVIAAPWLPTKGAMGNKPRDLTTMWMVKWLLFRLMFASGVVKLQSGCPTWWGLTALNYHFESQCIPTPLAYFSHHLPTWLLHLMVVGTYYIEIVVPIMFFAPFKPLRRFAFWMQVMLQLAILLTGNYTFFNLLTLVLCVSLLDPEFFGVKVPRAEKNSSGAWFLSRSFTVVFLGVTVFYMIKFFGLAVNPDYTITSKITFSRVEFDWFVSIAVPYASIMGLLTFGSTVAHTIVISLFDKKGCWSKFTSLLSSVFFGAVCLALFSITLVPFTSLHKETQRSLFPVVKDLHAQLDKYNVANSYGLFRRMTGVEKGRPEVILEYADNMDGPWKEYHFMYKIGNVSASPVFVAPHQPRLDWQMWFAALGTYHDNPWLVSLAYRLLQGEPSVVKLIDKSNAPKVPPKYIRASLYSYHYTKPTTATAQKGDWWQRKRENEYMPVFTKDHQPLVDFIKNLGYLDKDVPSKDNSKVLTATLDSIRELVDTNRPEHVMWGAVIALLAIILTAKFFK